MTSWQVKATFIALGIVAAVTVVDGTARAVDFPGTVSGADVMFRNGELLSVDLRAGYLWSFPRASYTGVGLVATAGAGIGGVSGAAGAITMFKCVHAFGCNSISLEAKLFRPAILSTWDHETRAGAELALGLYLFRLTGAVYRRIDGDSAPTASFGAGLQLLF